MNKSKIIASLAAGTLLASAPAAAAQGGQASPAKAASAATPKQAGSGKTPTALRPATTRGKIINGIPAEPGMLPYQVSLFRALDGHFCGGSLIDNQWVLTAAHCLMWLEEPTGFYVLGGTHDLTVPGEVFGVEAVFVHPQYNEKTSANDIALVRLAGAGQRSNSRLKTISPFALSAVQSRTVSGTAIVSGFGSTKEGGKASSQLLMADVPIVDNATCNAKESYNGSIVDSMICAGGNQKDSCQGDSGGPLVLGDEQRGYTLVGVVSFGEGCGRPMKYGVYTRVASYADWIRGTMGR